MGRLRASRIAAVSLGLSCSVSFATLAQAQSGAPPQINPPPVRSTLDDNGVNLATGQLQIQSVDLSIGDPSQGGLVHSRMWTGNGWQDSFALSVSYASGTASVSLPGTVVNFSRLISPTGDYQSTKGDGSQLTEDSNSFTFTDSRGTVIYFDKSIPDFTNTSASSALATSVTEANGKKTTLAYKYQNTTVHTTICSNSPWGYFCVPADIPLNNYRLNTVSTNTGYQLKYDYSADEFTVSKITALNLTTDYCVSNQDSCVISQLWPSVSYPQTSSSPGGTLQSESVVNSLNRTTTYSRDSAGRISAIKSPAASASDVTITYSGSTNLVSSIAKPSGTWSYAWSQGSTTLQGTITDPLSGQRVVVTDLASRSVLSDRDESLRTTSYTIDSYGRVTKATLPEGNTKNYEYDDRGNIKKVTDVSKTPGTPPDLVTLADYDATCSSIVKCNQPNWIKDPKGNQTDYSYDPASGLISTLTAPAAANGIRPQTRYGYTPLYGWFKNGSGVLSQAASPIYKLTTVSICQTGASCAGTADEVKTSTTYQAGSATVGSNLLPVSVSKGAGNGSLIASLANSYDIVGNVLTVDGPLSGSADMTRYRYDAARQLVGAVGPDPDGGGALKFRAQRYNYDLNGKVTAVEQGTVNSQSDGDWAGFSSLQQVNTSYDGAGRKIRTTATAGGATYSVAQYSYDAAGRLDCVALRMDPTQWSSQTNVCVPQTGGANGPDRITKNSYDPAGQVTSVTDGYGTSSQRVERVMSYTSNGQLQTIKDANNNLTTYEYDGFDRLSKTRYPVATLGAASSSTTDYEGFGYDPNGNVTSHRQRDGAMIYYGYDNLNRLTSKNRPNTVWWETDLTYGYDLFGRLTTATDTNGHSYGYSYDALGRKTSESSNWYGTMSSGYDLAGRRTSLTYPDGFYVNYDYLVTGEVSKVRENGAVSGLGVLETYYYDDLGRRVAAYQGNGTVTNYSYDAVSRLSSIAHDLGGTAQDLTLGFSYNPASQIVSASRSNDSYVFTQNYNVNRGYSINGLNQYSAAGTVSIGYDGRGNLISSGSSSYSYTSDNQLATSSGSNFAYDPLGRIFHESTPNSAMLYDGSDMMLERDAANGTIRRRYVYGPGTDEPIVWYEGSGTADRRWLHADERSSVVATTNGTGNVIALNSYDEYGIPASGNIGRFQYTGQMWLPNLGMYSFKARIYSPTLGRFMQTDPIGYGDGLNWHSYAKNDPINGKDPSGLGFQCVQGYCSGTGPNVGPTITVIGDPCASYAGGCSFVNNPIFTGTISGIGSYDPGVGFGNLTAFDTKPGKASSTSSSRQRGGKCPAPRSVHISGTLVAGGGGPGVALKFSGTLKDVSTGKSVSFTVTERAGGAGIGAGIYNVGGTLRGGFDVLSKPFSIGFAYAGYGPASIGTASIGNASGDLGEIDVGGALQTPGGAYLLGFPGAETSPKEPGSC